MVSKVERYGSKLVCFIGADIVSDLRTMDYNENKFQSVKEAIDALKIEFVPIYGQYKVGSSTSYILDPDRALLVAIPEGTEQDKPAVFVRKNLKPNAIMNGTVDAKQRYSTVMPAVIAGSATPAIQVWGMGEYQAVLTNNFPIACFGDTVESV
jgi:hypothetical protein